jgi:hypothetical protein
MDEMKKQIQRDLEEEGLDELLLQYLQYTVIEDPNLEGASKNDIRKRFRKWVASLTSDKKRVDPGEAKKWNMLGLATAFLLIRSVLILLLSTKLGGMVERMHSGHISCVLLLMLTSQLPERGRMGFQRLKVVKDRTLVGCILACTAYLLCTTR